MIPINNKLEKSTYINPIFGDHDNEQQAQKTESKIFILPEECYDPVTFEELNNPFLTRCGHSFNSSTILKMSKIASSLEVECPICRTTFNASCCYFNSSLKELIEKIKTWKENAKTP